MFMTDVSRSQAPHHDLFPEIALWRSIAGSPQSQCWLTVDPACKATFIHVYLLKT